MKTHGNKLILFTFALQLLTLFSIIALVYVVSYSGQTVVIPMTGYDPYDALRGRYLRMDNPDNKVPLRPGSAERYETQKAEETAVYVVLDRDPDSGISHFSHAVLDRPDHGTPYIKCMSRNVQTYDGELWVYIYPRIDRYYLNETHADQLDRSIDWNTDIWLSLKIWHGMYVADGIQVHGQKY